MRRLACGILGLAVLVVAALAQPATKGAIQAGSAAEADIRALLASQASAWNDGDLEGFLAGYWNSEQTTFVGRGGVYRGLQGLRERYRSSYPDGRAMGKLTFFQLEVTLLAPDAAMVLGHWQLERAGDRPGGVFTLVLRRFSQGWRIIHDHTSQFESSERP